MGLRERDIDDIAYSLWVHLSDHVKQAETAEDGMCEHCETAEVDCDDCREVMQEYLDYLERTYAEES